MKSTYSIVGMKHLGHENIIDALKPGVVVTLVREPHNKFDKNAVMVWFDGVHIGYIPKHSNVALSTRINDKGKMWTAPSPTLALDDSAPKQAISGMALDATFIRSPNSGYPMVSVGE